MARARTRKAAPEAPVVESQGSSDARERLIAASARVLAERGYDATTVKEVARVAGVNQGLVHYYFGSKDALLLATTREHSQRYAAELRRLREETPPEKLADASFAFGAELLRAAPELVRLRYELFALGLRNPELTSAVSELLCLGDLEVARTVAAFRGGDPEHPAPEDRHYGALIKACIDGLSLQHVLDARFDVAPVYALLQRMILLSVGSGAGAKPARRGGKAQGRRVLPRPRRRSSRPRSR